MISFEYKGREWTVYGDDIDLHVIVLITYEDERRIVVYEWENPDDDLVLGLKADIHPAIDKYLEELAEEYK